MPDGERRWIRVVSAEIQRDGRYLITQRPPHAVLPGLWEFPGGRVAEGESDHQALARSLAARLGVDAQVSDKLLEIAHDYDDYSVVLAVYRCAVEGEPRPLKVAACEWVRFEDLVLYPFPGADARTVRALLQEEP